MLKLDQMTYYYSCLKEFGQNVHEKYGLVSYLRGTLFSGAK